MPSDHPTTVHVVRGFAKESDGICPLYRSVMHDSTPGAYGAVFVRGDEVVYRAVCDRAQAHDLVNNPKYAGVVHADRRPDPRLVELKCDDNVPESTFPFRRAKSLEEGAKIDTLYRRARAALSSTHDARAFRGASATTDKAMFKATHCKGFTQYRGGFMDENGLMSDLTEVVPKSAAWVARHERVMRGFRDVVESGCIAPGATFRGITDRFASHLQLDSNDALYARTILEPAGYQSCEPLCGDATVRPRDVLVLQCGVGDPVTGEVAHYRHSVHVVPEETSGFRGTALAPLRDTVLTRDALATHARLDDANEAHLSKQLEELVVACCKYRGVRAGLVDEDEVYDRLLTRHVDTGITFGDAVNEAIASCA